MESPNQDRKFPVESYTDFQRPQSTEQPPSMGSCSPATSSPLPPGFGKWEQHDHQPDTLSSIPAVCALPQEQQQQQQQEQPQGPQGRQLLSPPTFCTESSAYMSPYSPYQSRNQNIWPSPPLRPGDIQYCVAFRDLPCQNNSPTSPGGWSSLSGCPPTSGFFESQHPGDLPSEMVCTPMSAHSQHSDMSTHYRGSYHPDTDVDMSAPSHAMPGNSAVPPPSSAGSPDGLQVGTPASFITPKIENQDQDAAFMESILVAPQPMSASNVRHDDKIDEPYAKLIYKALMSRPDYTMTLQELYQWFRDNTGKAKNERGGWQNSIRHNLSMNAAFKRRDRKRLEGNAPSACAEGEPPLAGEVKRANEWILEDWAVRDGVQSTTRYRKGNSGRRSSRRSSSQPDMRRINQRNSSARALSGQKGGCAARNSRMRSHLYSQGLSLATGRQYRLIESGLGSPPASSMPDPYYSMAIGISRIDPTGVQTPIVHRHNNSADFSPATAATEFFGLQMTGPRMGQPVASGGSGHSGIHSVSYMGQQGQMYQAPSPAEFPYSVSNVQLDYADDHASPDIEEQIRRFNNMVGTPRIDWAGN
ncbi:hypothetical protein ACHAQJ_003797 [Trichoderma viride]